MLVVVFSKTDERWPNSPRTDLPDCWILDRATVKWHRRKFVVVGIMDLQSRKLLEWEIVKPLQPKPVAALLTATVTRYGIPPVLVFWRG